MDSFDTKNKKHPFEQKPSGPVAGLGIAAMAAPYLFTIGAGGIALATAGFISMGVGIVYGLAMYALVKPPRQNKDSGPGGERGGLFQSVRNQARPYQPCQEVFGKRRVFPPLAAVPYTEQAGEDTLVRMLFHIGQIDPAVTDSGSYTITELKIGESAITNYSGDYKYATGYIKDRKIQRIYPNDVSTESSLPVEVTKASGGLTKTTAADTTEISLDVGCLDGLYAITDSGNYRKQTVKYTVQYRVSSPPGSWIDFNGAGASGVFKRRGETQGLVAWSHRITDLSPDIYDVKVVKTSDDHPPAGKGEDVTIDNLYWMALRSINSGQDAVVEDNAYLLALRIKTTGNFNSIVDSVNCIVERKLPTWDGSAWGNDTTTRNPAWAFASVLRRYVPDANIDGDALLTWAGNCTTNGFNFDAVIERATPAKDMLEDIAAVGRASRAIIDSKHTVIEDVAQATNKAHFSPRNAWGFKGNLQYLDYPHGIKARYIDETNGYQQEEITIYDDGYDAGNASEFETMEVFGAVNSNHVWKLVRYYMAVARLRPETFQVNTDAENLTVTRGDRVGLTYDVMLTGLGQARIKAIAVLDVTMDDTITMVSGSTYAAIVRKADNTFLSTSITLDVGEQSTVTLGSVTGVAVGDLMFFGESGEISQDCIIKQIEYGRNHSALLTLTNYNAAIYTADGGAIPTFTPVITKPPEINRVPPTVTIEGINVGYWPVTATDLTARQLSAFIVFTLGMSTDIDPYYFQVQYTEYDDPTEADLTKTWLYGPDIPLEARQAIIPVQDSMYYDVRIRSVSRYGITGAWYTQNQYQVSYTGLTPNDIGSLNLIGGGASWDGLDCAIQWPSPTDTWRVNKIRIDVKRTTPATVLRTVYLDGSATKYTYLFGENKKDNNGKPMGGLTFDAYAISQNNDQSSSAATLVVTHAAPAAPSGLQATKWIGGVEFIWNENNESDFSHFEYSVKVGTDFNF